MLKLLSKIAVLSMGTLFFSNAYGQVVILGNNLQPSNVSNTGAVVGTYQNSNFLWTPGNALVNMGDVSNGSSYSGDPDISNDGTKAAFTSTNPATNLNEFTLYDVGTQIRTYVGGGSYDFSGTIGSAFAMSGNGNYIVGRGYSANAPLPTKWETGTGTTQLQTNSPQGGGANSVSISGNVIGGFLNSSFGEMMGVVWKNGTPTMIMDSNGMPMTLVTKVSDDGNWAIANSYDQSAVIWNEISGVITIPPVNVTTQTHTGYPMSINSDGTKVVGYYRDAFNPTFDTNESFFWTPSTGSILLSQYVASLGLDAQGINFILPTDISPNGKYITGWGMKNGTMLGFRIEVPDSFLGVNTIDKKQISIYPNPVKDILNIDGANIISDVKICDMAGRNVLEMKEIKNGKINVSNLSKGVYLLKAVIDGKAEILKVIKE